MFHVDISKTKLWQTYRAHGELDGYCCERKLGFWRRAYAFVSDGVGNANARCNVGIHEHILDQGGRCLLWA